MPVYRTLQRRFSSEAARDRKHGLLLLSELPPSIEIEWVPAQGTSTCIARLEPLEQTAGVVHVLARRAALLRQLAVAADNAVADRALGLALERARDVAAERGDAVGDGAVL